MAWNLSEGAQIAVHLFGNFTGTTSQNRKNSSLVNFISICALFGLL